MEKYYIYMHRNKINNKVYIGQTCNLRKRWSGNGARYKECPLFWEAICKYGWDNFEHIILFSDLSKKQADKLEKEMIIKYDSRNKKHGYNMAEGGNTGKPMLGKKQTEYQIQNQKEFMSQQENNPMLNGKVVWGETHEHPRGMLGKHHSNDAIKKISEYQQENCPVRKKIQAIMPNGEVRIYPSIISVQKDLKISDWITRKLLKNGEPYKFTKHVTSDNKEYLLTLEGLILQYLQ